MELLNHMKIISCEKKSFFAIKNETWLMSMTFYTLVLQFFNFLKELTNVISRTILNFSCACSIICSTTLSQFLDLKLQDSESNFIFLRSWFQLHSCIMLKLKSWIIYLVLLLKRAFPACIEYVVHTIHLTKSLDLVLKQRY